MALKAQFFNYDGMEAQSDAFHYSQTVKIGAIVKTSGQGGWDKQGNVPKDAAKQVDLVFSNATLALQAADASLSWRNVYAVRSYHTDLDETAGLVVEKFKQLMPDHRVIFTCVEIRKLGIEGMKLEMEIEACI